MLTKNNPCNWIIISGVRKIGQLYCIKKLETCQGMNYQIRKKVLKLRYLTFQMVYIISKVLTSKARSSGQSGQPYLIFGFCFAIIVVYDFKN